MKVFCLIIWRLLYTVIFPLKLKHTIDQEISKNKNTGHDLLYGKHLQERPRKGAILNQCLVQSM